MWIGSSDMFVSEGFLAVRVQSCAPTCLVSVRWSAVSTQKC